MIVKSKLKISHDDIITGDHESTTYNITNAIIVTVYDSKS